MIFSKKEILSIINEKSILTFFLLISYYTVSSQVIKNNNAEIVCQTGSFWVIKNGDMTLVNSTPGATTFDNLKVRSGATLTIDAQSGAIVNNALTVEGNILLKSNTEGTAAILTEGTISQGTNTTTAERYMTGGKWHLTSSPVENQSINGVITNSSNSIAMSGASYAMMDYSEAENNWNNYFTSATSGNVSSGKGYAVQRTSNGVVNFTGTLPSSDIDVTATQSGEGWMLVGNPYPTSIGVTIDASSTDNFLLTNLNNLDPSYVALYLWVEEDAYDGNRSDYKIINNAGMGSLVQDYVQAEQGFFVKSKTGSHSVSFTKNMRAIETGIDFKSAEVSWPLMNLVAESSDKKSSTMVAFNNQMTYGLDETYDAGMFKPDPDFAVYTRLLEDNGVDFSIQCLPDNTYENMVIPVGLDAPAGKKVTFYAKNNELDSNCLMILEDRQKGIFTDLNVSGNSYTVELKNKSQGVGRFYIHTSELTIDDTKTDFNSLFQIIPQRSLNKILILGEVNQKTIANIYDISGRLILSTQLEESDQNTVLFNEQKSGIYLIQVRNASGIKNEKLYW